MSAAALLDYLHGRREEMIDLLIRLARLETPSLDAAAQAPALALLTGALEDVGCRVRRLRGRRSGGQLLAWPRHRTRRRPIQLLLGHIDTVWPAGTLAQMPVERDGERLRGPGVFDMKGGLVQLVFALAALRQLNLTPAATPVVFINSDEETGSLDSTRQVRRLARIADRALVLEPALGSDGRLKTARKGVGRFLLQVHGRAAHAGLNPEAGASAILELAHQIQRLFALNDPAVGVTVNVGVIAGGLLANVVAPHAQARIDARAPDAAAAQRVAAAIHGLTPATPGVRLEVTGGFTRPPMERTAGTAALWRLARDCGRELGLTLDEAAVGGGSDANTTSQYIPTLDGLGVVGDGAHARHEFVCTHRLAERAALLALLLLAPPLAMGKPPCC